MRTRLRWSIRRIDEDFGYVTLEAFLAQQAGHHRSDSGGPNEFVVDGVNGFVCAPKPEAIADAMNRLAGDRTRAAAIGDAGYATAARITWDGVIEKLVMPSECIIASIPSRDRAE